LIILNIQRMARKLYLYLNIKWKAAIKNKADQMVQFEFQIA